MNTQNLVAALLNDFVNLAQVYETDVSLVLAANRRKDGAHFLLKILWETSSSAEERLKLDAVLQHVKDRSHIPGIVHPVEIRRTHEGCVMLFEDSGARFLKTMVKPEGVSIAVTLKLAIQLCETVGQIHSSHVVHQDLTPYNILYSQDSLTVTVTESVAPAGFVSPAHNLPLLLFSEGGLAYVSPEQTGRTKRGIDYRSDYYSLGVTLYELLTGRLPFDATDSLEMLHCHIARPPVPPHQVNPEIPQPVSDIVMKLLNKDPEDRYQSSYGLRADLRKCLQQFELAADISRFDLGAHDVPERLRGPSQLHGRETDIDALKSAFNSIMHGNVGLVTVAGEPGIGKTSLINEIASHVEDAGAFFISGKFNQFGYTKPYEAFEMATRMLTNRLLREPPDNLQMWRESFTSALGSGGAVLTDFVPELELIIGPQPPLQEVGPKEVEHRFKVVFQRLMGAITDSGHPLVLFLDDYHWADVNSIRLLEWLVAGTETRALLVICAYRDTEVHDAHPCMRTTARLQDDGRVLSRLAVSRLTSTDIQDLTSDMLHKDKNAVGSLTRLIEINCAGNPLAIIEYLRSLHKDGLLRVDYRTGEWKWNVEEIRLRPPTDDVVKLLTENIGGLPDRAKELVKYAACLGNRFDLAVLASAMGCPEGIALRDIWPAIEQGLILPEQEKSDYGDDTRPQGSTPARLLRFAHDKIQQASYGMVPASERHKIHRRLGEILADHPGSWASHDRAFLVADQFNAARSSFTDPPDHVRLVQVNFSAGRKAKSSGAHSSALHYLNAAIALMDEAYWESEYGLSLEVHLECAEAAWLSGDFSLSHQLVSTAVRRAKTVLDRVKAYEIQSQAYFAEGRPSECIEVTLSALEELGVSIPRNPNKIRTILSLLKSETILRIRMRDDISSLPPMRDPLGLAAMRLFAHSATAVYSGAPRLIPEYLRSMLALSLKYGKAPSMPILSVGYAVVISNVIGHVQRGYLVGREAERLALESPSGMYRARAQQSFNTLVRHLKEHVHDCAQGMLEAHGRALEAGDLEYAALGLLGHLVASFVGGRNLVELSFEMTRAVEEIRRFNGETYLDSLEMHLQAVVNLARSEQEIPWLLEGEHFQEKSRVPALMQSNHRYWLFNVYYIKVLLSYLFYQNDQALLFAAEARSFLDATAGLMQVPVFHFYESLAAIQACLDLGRSKRKPLLKLIGRNEKRLFKLAKHAPMNHRHKHLLVKAERLRLQGDRSGAKGLYRQAIESARANEFVHEEGLARELAGRYSLSMGDVEDARVLLTEARACYHRWGAQGKVRALEEQYPGFFGSANARVTQRPVGSVDPAPAIPTDIVSVPDYRAIVDALQAISTEIEFDKLVHRSMNMVMAVGGATRAVLIVVDQGELFVKGEVSAGDKNLQLLKSTPLDDFKALPKTVVNVVARSNELLVLENASVTGDFTNDPYIRNSKSRSIICLPLIHRGSLQGLLYLENTLSSGVFSPDIAGTLQLLCTQAAISIENSLLYSQINDYSHQLERKIDERTRDLEKAVHALKQEVREKEAAQRQSQNSRREAEAANRAKSQFLTSMSHELRTPLNSIIGFSELLMSQQFGQLNERQLESLEHVSRSGRHQLQLVNDLLDLAKVEAGKMDLELSRVHIGTVLSQSLYMVKERALKHRLELQLNITESIADLEIQTDEVKVKRVLYNLLSNAVKFTPDGGAVSLACHRDGEILVIIVSDSGIGIEPQDQSRILDAFEQVASPHGQDRQGTGLGLSLCKSLVRFLGGRLWVESDGKGKGSTFTFTIPILEDYEAEAERDATKNACPAHDPLGRGIPGDVGTQSSLRILAVEDNEANAKLLRFLLQAKGFQVMEARTAEEGMKLAAVGFHIEWSEKG